MPMPIYYAHLLAKKLADVRKNGILDFLRPDGKTQVTVEYDDGKPVRIDTVLIAAQHSESVEIEDIKRALTEHVIKSVIPETLIDGETKILVNPTRKFIVRRPQEDSRITGRKIIINT